MSVKLVPMEMEPVPSKTSKMSVPSKSPRNRMMNAARSWGPMAVTVRDGMEVEVSSSKLLTMNNGWQMAIVQSFTLSLVASILTEWPWGLLRGDEKAAMHDSVADWFLDLPSQAYYAWYVVWATDFVFVAWQYFQSVTRSASQWRMDTIMAIAPGYCMAHLFFGLWAYSHIGTFGERIAVGLDFVCLLCSVLSINRAHSSASQFKDEDDIRVAVFVRTPIAIWFAWMSFALVQCLSSFLVVFLRHDADPYYVRVASMVICLVLMVGTSLVMISWRRSVMYGFVAGYLFIALAFNHENISKMNSGERQIGYWISLLELGTGIGLIGVAIGLKLFTRGSLTMSRSMKSTSRLSVLGGLNL